MYSQEFSSSIEIISTLVDIIDSVLELTEK